MLVEEHGHFVFFIRRPATDEHNAESPYGAQKMTYDVANSLYQPLPERLRDEAPPCCAIVMPPASAPNEMLDRSVGIQLRT